VTGAWDHTRHIAEGIVKRNKREEDRRSCHNISFILGLAVAANHRAMEEAAFAAMVMNWRIVSPGRN
jgi:predicted fused transcriptional regulator/phosphomethylpyrimidine kinase